MAKTREVPEWEAWVLEELRARDPEKGPQLVAVYKAAYLHFEGDFSATQVIRYLVRHGCVGAEVHRSTMSRMLDICCSVRNKHMPASPATK